MSPVRDGAVWIGFGIGFRSPLRSTGLSSKDEPEHHKPDFPSIGVGHVDLSRASKSFADAPLNFELMRPMASVVWSNIFDDRSLATRSTERNQQDLTAQHSTRRRTYPAHGENWEPTTVRKGRRSGCEWRWHHAVWVVLTVSPAPQARSRLKWF